MKEFRILAPTAILGYGFPVDSFKAGLALKPDLIAIDAGSTDPGPYYLGAGVSFTDRQAVKRDLSLILQAAVAEKIPVVIGSAGGAGANPHLAWNAAIIEEIAAEEGLQFKMALLEAEIEQAVLQSAYQAGKIVPLPPAPELSEANLETTVRVVAQMGLEPLQQALAAGAEVVLAGRCYDPAVFAALPVLRGFDAGLAIHLGKILECAAIAATPGSGSDCLFGWLREDHFEVAPLNPIRQCTTLSVAAHTLYEKSNPYLLPGPGGRLDLRATKFEQVTKHKVRVSGSSFQQSPSYQVKLEGVKLIGYRTIAIAGTRDPIMIREIDQIIQAVKERVADNFAGKLEYHLDFKIYGKNGVMGSFEPESVVAGHELGIVIEAVAEKQELADTVCSFARSTMLHYGYPGRIATAGNLAFPYSPSDFHAGAVYVFSIYHLMEITDPCAPFPLELKEVGR